MHNSEEACPGHCDSEPCDGAGGGGGAGRGVNLPHLGQNTVLVCCLFLPFLFLRNDIQLHSLPFAIATTGMYFGTPFILKL